MQAMRKYWGLLNPFVKALVLFLPVAAIALHLWLSVRDRPVPWAYMQFAVFVVLGAAVYLGWERLRPTVRALALIILVILGSFLVRFQVAYWLVGHEIDVASLLQLAALVLLLVWVRMLVRQWLRPGKARIVVLALLLGVTVLGAKLADESELVSYIVISILYGLVFVIDASVAIYYHALPPDKEETQRVLPFVQTVVFTLTLLGVLWYAQEAHRTRIDTGRMAEATVRQADELNLARASPWVTNPISTVAEGRATGQLQEDCALPADALLIEVTNQGTMRAVNLTVFADWLGVLRDTRGGGARGTEEGIRSAGEPTQMGVMAASPGELPGHLYEVWEVSALGSGEAAWLCLSAPTPTDGINMGSAQEEVSGRLVLVWWDPTYTYWDIVLPIRYNIEYGRWETLPYYAKPVRDRPVHQRPRTPMRAGSPRW